MLDVCLLGCGGMMPLPYRWLTALLVRYNGKCLLIDCGEGTQIALKEKGWSAKPIDIICLTHYHADHISGLPGLLLTMGNAERTEPLQIIGPKGLSRVMQAVRTIAPELPFAIELCEITEEKEDFVLDELQIHAFKLNHSMLCYGYTLNLPRKGKFDALRAKELGLAVQYWNALQHGNDVEVDGQIYTPDMVMGPPRKGLKVTYCTDTRPTESIVQNASGSDLFICEGMYGEWDKFDKAKQNRHMMFGEAAKLARDARVNELWLTHYSPSLTRPEPFMEEVKKIFPNAKPGKDGKSVTLLFDDNAQGSAGTGAV